ncbi:hypothetical protein AN911_04975 [Mycobacteroides immunogenum]|uniref:Uncharacterized protein n=1 Tax=Mycobacteroides immunogenum TaxID=83262 RepID=A0A7V8RV54_9MYCO|nr:hypothetical protein AN909_21080 [Mycobacteroides immunogenum]KPG06368.1 hypothetical protein AN908_21460 [Mycobacteroides immunogenum]KPG16774.1 hypothetical protein AN910_00655 [Mycobacteroides immunogenum]KPG24717.1 hypothetical protein AN911_04975 [Mycobacteroides immunogenum]KPG38589.1 hypothetical protein AN914_11990 [Mycobacteroides immunogenum]
MEFGVPWFGADLLTRLRRTALFMRPSRRDDCGGQRTRRCARRTRWFRVRYAERQRRTDDDAGSNQ